MTLSTQTPKPAPPPSRPRKPLVFAALAAVGLPALGACTQGNAVQTPRAEAQVIRIAAADATNSSGLDPRVASQGASILVMQHVYDSLMTLDGGDYTMSLATSVEPNADATEWAITIRDDAMFHDGRPVTAEDVAFSMATLAGEDSNRASVYADVAAEDITVVDDHTLTVPLRNPRGDFRESVLVVYSPVFPKGTKDFEAAIGSGPYKLESSDDRAVRLVANQDYWGGAPAVDTLEISRMADPAARVSAVTSGQVDYAMGVSASSARAADSKGDVEVVRGGATNSSALAFTMNQTLAPFDDPRVRRAVRLAVDREALTEAALGEYGVPGDDVVGMGLPGYPEAAETRERDVDEAAELFEAAGVDTLTLRAAEVVPGMLTAAGLLRQQLAEAGVELDIKEEPIDAYYADVTALTKHPFQVFYYSNRPTPVHLSATTTKTAVFNVTGAGPDHWERLAAAQSTVDDDARRAAFDEIGMDFYDNGGDVIWGFQETLDLADPSLEGVEIVSSTPEFDQATLGSK